MKKRQEGSAMIVVMVVMIMTVSLALTLLLVSSVMISNATRANQKEQCRVTSVSVSNVLIEKVKNFHYDNTMTPDPYPTGWERGLQAKLQSVRTTQWYAYDKNDSSMDQITKNGKDYFTYELNGDTLPGKTRLELYWVDESESQSPELDMSNPEEAETNFENVVLYLKVTNTVGEESSTILNTFQPDVITKTEKDSITGEEKTVWENWKWKYLGRDWERGDS